MACSAVAYYYFIFLLATAVFAVRCCAQQTDFCMNQSFAENRVFTDCVDLATLDSTLHWTYDNANAELSIAYTATMPDGWVSWGINPTRSGMIGAEVLGAFRNQTTGVWEVYQYRLSNYAAAERRSMDSFDVLRAEAAFVESATTIFATMVLKPGTMKINTTWQLGSLANNEMHDHEVKPDNMNSFLELDLTNYRKQGTPPPPSSPSPPNSSGGNKGFRYRSNIAVIMYFLVVGLCS